jgi:glycosyltransferase involved in cell wall biosynthesis
MRISLIITTYNRPNALSLVLKSIVAQTKYPDEIIFADDGSDDSTKKCITDFQKSSTLKVIHSWQEDKGFRLAKSRNKAIAISNFEYIVLVDGDMVLHPKFIQDHLDKAEPGYFVQGTRVLLTQNRTRQALNNSTGNFSFLSRGIRNRKNAIHSNYFSKLLSKKKNHIKGIKTCNMSFYKEDCLNINGFNNDFKGWGREDSEFAVRLLNSGINRKNVRFNMIQFHLWHKEATRDSLVENDATLHSAIDNHVNWCDNGISKYL